MDSPNQQDLLSEKFQNLYDAHNTTFQRIELDELAKNRRFQGDAVKARYEYMEEQKGRQQSPNSTLFNKSRLLSNPYSPAIKHFEQSFDRFSAQRSKLAMQQERTKEFGSNQLYTLFLSFLILSDWGKKMLMLKSTHSV